jgi:hypothetical protein
VMLSLRTSGATYLSCWAFRRLPTLARNSGCSWLLGLETGRERSVLRKSITGLVVDSGPGRLVGFVGVESGGGIVLSIAVLAFAASEFLGLISGFSFVERGDLIGSVSRGTISSCSVFLGVDTSFGSSDPRAGDFLRSSGTGCSIISDVSGIGAAVVSSLKSSVSSLVVGAAIFSDNWRDSCASRLAGLELRLFGLAFMGGVTDLMLPASVRMSLESERFSRAGPKGVSLTGEEGLLRPLGLGLPSVGTISVLDLCAFARAMFSIQLGCAGLEAASLGESGLARALSIQLDLLGLNRLEGLPIGDLRPPSSSALVL